MAAAKLLVWFENDGCGESGQYVYVSDRGFPGPINADGNTLEFIADMVRGGKKIKSVELIRLSARVTTEQTLIENVAELKGE